MSLSSRSGIVAGMLFALGAAASAQTVVNNVALTNPDGISVSFFQNGNGASNYLWNEGDNVPDPDAFPDTWTFNSSTAGSFRPESFTMNSDPSEGTSFQLTIQNTGGTITVDSTQLLVVVSGLEPANPAYELSSVEFSVNSPYNGPEFDLRVFPELDPGSYDSFFGINEFFTGVLALEIAGNFSFLSGTNIVIDGTFDAIDTAAVPEPAVAALLLAIGAAGFVMWRRRVSAAG